MLRQQKRFNCFIKNQIKLHKTGYKNYSTNRKLGRVIYDPFKLSEHAIKYTYKLHISKWEQKQNSNTVSEERIRKLIMKQCSKLPCAATYDYRNLINSKGSLDDEALDQHFNTDLSGFIERVTTSDNSKRTITGSTSYRNLRKLRIRIISLLCMAMNPTSTFLQTMLGVVAYLYGLRDKGFDMLNAFGIISSVDQI